MNNGKMKNIMRCLSKHFTGGQDVVEEEKAIV